MWVRDVNTELICTTVMPTSNLSFEALQTDFRFVCSTFCLRCHETVRPQIFIREERSDSGQVREEKSCKKDIFMSVIVFLGDTKARQQIKQ